MKLIIHHFDKASSFAEWTCSSDIVTNIMPNDSILRQIDNALYQKGICGNIGGSIWNTSMHDEVVAHNCAKMWSSMDPPYGTKKSGD